MIDEDFAYIQTDQELFELLRYKHSPLGRFFAWKRRLKMKGRKKFWWRGLIAGVAGGAGLVVVLQTYPAVTLLLLAAVIFTALLHRRKKINVWILFRWLIGGSNPPQMPDVVRHGRRRV